MKRVILDTIKLSWFMSTGENVEHSFNDSPTFITGENRTVGQIEQKNGCGKTVVFFDAVLFAFYGQVSRERFKMDDIPFNKGATKKKCIVDLNFDVVVGDTVKKCKIVRTLNPSKLILTVDGKDLSQSSKDSTQEYLVRELLGGISIDVFKNAIAMKLDKSKAFMEMSKPDREKFIGGVFDLTFLKNAEKLARDEYNQNKKLCTEIETKVGMLVPRVEKIESQIEKTNKDIQHKVDENNKYLEKIDIAITNFVERDRPEEINVDNLNNELDTKREALNKKLKEYNTEKNESLNTVRDLNNQVSNKKSTIRKNISDNSRDEKSKTCPTCKRDMDEECVSGILETIKERLEENKRLEVDIEKLEIEITDTTNKTHQNDDVIEKINKGLQAVDTKRDSLSKDVLDNQKLIREHAEYMSTLDKLKEKRVNIERDIENISNSSVIETLNVDLDETKTDLKTNRSNLTRVKNDIEVLEVTKHIFSENGLRKTILGKLVTLFNTNVNMYLKRLEAPCTVEFDDTFDYVLKSLGGIEIPYGGLSGGERLRVVTALAFTFKDILRIQNQISLSISIYDEWFDAAIDERGLEIISEILQERNDSYGDTPYIITHRTELNIEDSNTVKVVKENGMSFIEN